MEALVQKIKTAGTYVGGGIVKVDSFLNHQIDSALMAGIGSALQRRYSSAEVHAIVRDTRLEVARTCNSLRLHR